MEELHWVTVAQPLYLARTGMCRSLIRGERGKTADDWQETLESAESGLDSFCQAERVYAIGTRGEEPWDMGRPAYLTAHGVLRDNGSPESELLRVGDEAHQVVRDAREWVAMWKQTAEKRLAELDGE